MEAAIPTGLPAEVQNEEGGDRYQMLEAKLRQLNGSIESLAWNVDRLASVNSHLVGFNKAFSCFKEAANAAARRLPERAQPSPPPAAAEPAVPEPFEPAAEKQAAKPKTPRASTGAGGRTSTGARTPGSKKKPPPSKRVEAVLKEVLPARLHATVHLKQLELVVKALSEAGDAGAKAADVAQRFHLGRVQ
ncbi:hypothetical protein T484DRAFT_1889115, partial [Baffinella frigidus]